MTFPHKHLLGIRELSADDIATILALAEAFKPLSSQPIKKAPTLRGRTIINLFFESSTRTRTSFEIAAKRLSADAINISVATSSVNKGETLLDTARNLEAMAADVIVIRHACSGAAHLLAQNVSACVINAGDGSHEHPTQALLDALTIKEQKGRLAGLEIAIIGDITHSRVARSNLHLLTKLGANVRIAGPPTLIPPGIAQLTAGNPGRVTVTTSIEAALAQADVVMMLRVQLERQAAAYFPSLREYSLYYGLNAQRLKLAQPDALVLHPGPINRGIEIASDVADGANSLILGQVTNGVAVRMAILYLVLGGQPDHILQELA